MRIASQGYRYVATLLGLALLALFHPATRVASAVFGGLAVFVAFFFRDPDRTPPADPGLIVSPADGRVVRIGPATNGDSHSVQVSIFLSLFDVHINRSPLAGVVTGVKYTPGRFLPAFRSEASTDNEQNEIELSDGASKIIVRQIAGVVARRIVFTKKLNDRLERGERFGLIQFGSRVDVLLPPEATLRVAVGDKVRGGESVLAERS